MNKSQVLGLRRLRVLLAVAFFGGCNDKVSPAPANGAAEVQVTRDPPNERRAPLAVVQTAAQRLRAGMTADELRMIREELAPMRAKNQWPADEQDRYLKGCEAAKKDDASINTRMCECTMEVVMNTFSTADSYRQYLRDNDHQTENEDLKTMTGLCTAAYGDDAPTAQGPDETVDSPATDGGESGSPPETTGEPLLRKNGCSVCHSVDGSRLVGPSFRGRWGKKVSTSKGKVEVNAAYIAESIQKPMAKIAEGFAPACPPSTMASSEIDEVVAFIRKVNDKNARIEPKK